MSTDVEFDRTILAVSGGDRLSFLKGLVTNDVSDGIVYSALLTPQGKYLADFFLISREDKVLVDISTDLAQGLVARLSMYKLRADVQIEMTKLKVGRGLEDMPAGAFSDPRHPAMGWRDYGGADSQPDVDWTDIRVQHCIPAAGAELSSATYILEAGFDRLNGVDFKKGCFVGQEVTARMRHKTELRKGFRTVRIDGAAPLGTEVTRDGRPCGTVFSQSNGLAIAHLRLDRAGGEMQAGDADVALID